MIQTVAIFNGTDGLRLFEEVQPVFEQKRGKVIPVVSKSLLETSLRRKKDKLLLRDSLGGFYHVPEDIELGVLIRADK